MCLCLRNSRSPPSHNNVFGTLTLAAAATRHGAKVVLLSTDKAVEPASVMGATKRVAEHIVLQAGGVALRLGNVLGSSDSVTEIFARQIARGGPLTVTVPAARRYFLSIDEAVDLLLVAAAQPESAGVVCRRDSKRRALHHRPGPLHGATRWRRAATSRSNSPGRGRETRRRSGFGRQTSRLKLSRQALLLDEDRHKRACGRTHWTISLAGFAAPWWTATPRQPSTNCCRLVPDYTPSAIAAGMATGLRSQVSR